MTTHLAERLSRRQNGKTLGLRGIGSLRWRSGPMSRDGWRKRREMVGEMVFPDVMIACILMCATTRPKSNRKSRKNLVCTSFSRSCRAPAEAGHYMPAQTDTLDPARSTWPWLVVKWGRDDTTRSLSASNVQHLPLLSMRACQKVLHNHGHLLSLTPESLSRRGRGRR